MDSLPSNNQDIVQSLDAIARALGKPISSFSKYLDNGTASRQVVAPGVTAPVSGIDISYTAPAFPVILFVISSALINCPSNVARYGVSANSSLFGSYTFQQSNPHHTHTSFGLLTVAPGATINLGAYAQANGVNLELCNASTDVVQRFSTYSYIAFRGDNV